MHQKQPPANVAIAVGPGPWTAGLVTADWAAADHAVIESAIPASSQHAASKQVETGPGSDLSGTCTLMSISC